MLAKKATRDEEDEAGRGERAGVRSRRFGEAGDHREVGAQEDGELVLQAEGERVCGVSRPEPPEAISFATAMETCRRKNLRKDSGPMPPKVVTITGRIVSFASCASVAWLSSFSFARVMKMASADSAAAER